MKSPTLVCRTGFSIQPPICVVNFSNKASSSGSTWGQLNMTWPSKSVNY